MSPLTEEAGTAGKIASSSQSAPTDSHPPNTRHQEMWMLVEEFVKAWRCGTFRQVEEVVTKAERAITSDNTDVR